MRRPCHCLCLSARKRIVVGLRSGKECRLKQFGWRQRDMEEQEDASFTLYHAELPGKSLQSCTSPPLKARRAELGSARCGSGHLLTFLTFLPKGPLGKTQTFAGSSSLLSAGYTASAATLAAFDLDSLWVHCGSHVSRTLMKGLTRPV